MFRGSDTRPPSYGRRLASAVVLGLAAAPLLATGMALPAVAHTELVDSTPADGELLASAPRTITLVFSDDMDQDFVNLALSQGSGDPVPMEARVEANKIIAEVAATESDEVGDVEWRLSYRVVSADGHPVAGTLTFTVEQDRAPRETADPTEEESEPHATQPQPSATSSDSGEAGWSTGMWWLLGLGAAAAVGLALVFSRGSRGR